jgi:hypothetical protein
MITVGETEIAVPLPDGFAEVLSEMKPYAEYATACVPSTNRQLLFLIPSEDAALAANGGLPETSRTFYVQSTHSLIPITATYSDFSGLKKVLREQNTEMVKNAKAQLPSELEKMSRDASKVQNATMDISVSEMTPLPPHFESERAIGYSMIISANVSIKNQEAVAAKSAVTLTYALIKSKIILLYCTGSESDLEWTRNESLKWVEAVISANPSSEAVLNRENATKRSLIDWSQVGGRTLIGAVVGSVIGLFLHFSKKKQKS